MIKRLLWKSFEARAIAKWKIQGVTWQPKQLQWVKAVIRNNSLPPMFPLHWQRVKWHWVGGIIKGFWLLLTDHDELKQSGSMIIHSFNQTCLVVKISHYYSWEMENIPTKTSKSNVLFVQTLQSNLFMFLCESRTPIPSKNNNNNNKKMF